MDWSRRCRACGGPVKIERNWRGDERVVCDAYWPCRVNWRGELVPHLESRGEWNGRLKAWTREAA